MSQEPAPKSVKLSDKEPAQFTTQPAQPPVDPQSWTIDQVYQWAVDIVKLDPEDAQKLKIQKITGKSLHGMTREALERYGIPGGPAFILSEAIRKLLPSKDVIHGS